MNSIIKDQLNKCKVAKIPSFEDSATYIYIPKVNYIQTTNMLPNHAYLVKIKPNIKNNDTIAFNWNNGVKPLYNYYRAEKVGEVGNMIKLNGIAFNVDTGESIFTQPFYGYLPVDGFEIIEEV